MSTAMPNFVTVSQQAAELLRFVENAAIFNLYLAILDHPRCPLMHLKSQSKYGVNRTFTFQDIVILKFCEFGLKRLFRPPKFTFNPQKTLPAKEEPFGVLAMKSNI